MTVYDYREITLKDDLCLEISRDTDIENPRENDCNAATFYCLKSPRRKIGDIIDSAYYLNETKRTLAKTGEYAILPIYIYEHSGIALCTAPFSDIWDSACIGFAAANINDFMKQRISDTPVSRCEAMHRAYSATTMDEIKQIAKEHTGFIKTMWCGDLACEEAMKEQAGLSSRCMPFAQEHLSDVCPVCGKPAQKMVVWGVAY